MAQLNRDDVLSTQIANVRNGGGGGALPPDAGLNPIEIDIVEEARNHQAELDARTLREIGPELGTIDNGYINLADVADISRQGETALGEIVGDVENAHNDLNAQIVEKKAQIRGLRAVGESTKSFYEARRRLAFVGLLWVLESVLNAGAIFSGESVPGGMIGALGAALLASLINVAGGGWGGVASRNAGFVARFQLLAAVLLVGANNVALTIFRTGTFDLSDFTTIGLLGVGGLVAISSGVKFKKKLVPNHYLRRLEREKEELVTAHERLLRGGVADVHDTNSAVQTDLSGVVAISEATKRAVADAQRQIDIRSVSYVRESENIRTAAEAEIDRCRATVRDNVGSGVVLPGYYYESAALDGELGTTAINPDHIRRKAVAIEEQLRATYVAVDETRASLNGHAQACTAQIRALAGDHQQDDRRAGSPAAGPVDETAI